MTEAFEDRCVIRAKPGEIKSLIRRIESLYSPLPYFQVHPYGLGFDSQTVAETLIDDLQLNREGKTELSLEVNAAQANIARPGAIEARA